MYDGDSSLTAASQSVRSRDAVILALATRKVAPGGNPIWALANMLPLADGLVVLAASAIAYLLRYGTEAMTPEIPAVTLLAVVLCINALRAGGVYRNQFSDGLVTQIARAVRAWCAISLGLVLLGYLTKTSDSFSRVWTVSSFLLVLFGLAGVRVVMSLLVQHWRRTGRLARNVAVVDLSGHGEMLAERLAARGSQDVRLLGVYRDGAAADGGPDIATLTALSHRVRIDEVMVVPARMIKSGSTAEAWTLDSAIRRLSIIPTHLHICPELPSFAATPRAVAMLFDTPVLTLCRRPLPGWHVVAKRIEDLALGSVLLVLLAPLMAAIAVLIRCDSPGPILFRQKRLGFNGNEFTVFKFRTMVHRPEEADVPQARRDDPRVTRLGRFLRSKSFDELPQIFNVLCGDMSLVGPRPHALAHNVKYAALIDDYLGRHRMAPGITGWAQVNGFRGETDTLEKMQRRVEYDLAYIDGWSVTFDLKILMQTALSVLVDRNAF